MLLEQIPPEDRSEVVKIAVRLQQEQEAHQQAAQEQAAFESAAGEMGFSSDVLQRAANELQQQRIQKAISRRKVRTAAIVACGLVLASAVVFKIAHPAAPAALNYVFSAQNWKMSANPETQANITFGNVDGHANAATIHVTRFAARPDGQYFANLDAPVAGLNLSGYKTASFFVKGAGLANVRLYLEAGPTERWRSPEIHTGPTWNRETVDLSRFDHQVRNSSADPWKRVGADPPQNLDKVSFKVGEYMNDVSASGEVSLDGLEVR